MSRSADSPHVACRRSCDAALRSRPSGKRSRWPRFVISRPGMWLPRQDCGGCPLIEYKLAGEDRDFSERGKMVAAIVRLRNTRNARTPATASGGGIRLLRADDGQDLGELVTAGLLYWNISTTRRFAASMTSLAHEDRQFPGHRRMGRDGKQLIPDRSTAFINQERLGYVIALDAKHHRETLISYSSHQSSRPRSSCLNSAAPQGPSGHAPDAPIRNPNPAQQPDRNREAERQPGLHGHSSGGGNRRAGAAIILIVAATWRIHRELS